MRLYDLGAEIVDIKGNLYEDEDKVLRTGSLTLVSYARLHQKTSFSIY